MPRESLTFLVNIDVEDVDKAIRFYADALGLTLHRRLFSDMVAEMHGGPAPLYLLQKAQGSSPSASTAQVRDYRRHWSPVHLDFVVAEIDTAVERALHAGATIEGGVQRFAWGRIAVMSDPFGNGFCLLQWIGAGYDDASHSRSARSASGRE